MAMVAAVAFDYFYTLVDPSMTKVLAAEQLRATLVPNATTSEFQDARRRASAQLRRRVHPSFRTFHDGWIEYGDALFASFGVTGGGEPYAQSWAEAHASAPLYPDAERTLEALRRAGLRVAILSDADCDYFYTSIGRHRLDVDMAMCSEELGCYKPDPLSFRSLCERLGELPTEILYVGDGPRKDVEGARRAGLRAAWIDRGRDEWPASIASPSLRITSLSELVTIATA